MGANFFGGSKIDRTRVGLLLGDAGLGQIVENGLGLYFQVARQFVNADLVGVGHSPVDFSFSSALFSSVALGSSEEASD